MTDLYPLEAHMTEEDMREEQLSMQAEFRALVAEDVESDVQQEFIDYLDAYGPQRSTKRKEISCRI